VAIERFALRTKTVLIEKSDRLGAGSTLASLENFRTCWPTLCLAKQMQRSVEVFHNADQYLGEGVALSLAVKQQGYLFCAFNEQQAETFKSDVKRLHEIGLMHIEYLDAAEVKYRFGGRRAGHREIRPGRMAGSNSDYRYAASAESGANSARYTRSPHPH
jgi:hypothetical protein